MHLVWCSFVGCTLLWFIYRCERGHGVIRLFSLRQTGSRAWNARSLVDACLLGSHHACILVFLLLPTLSCLFLFVPMRHNPRLEKIEKCLRERSCVAWLGDLHFFCLKTLMLSGAGWIRAGRQQVSVTCSYIFDFSLILLFATSFFCNKPV